MTEKPEILQRKRDTPYETQEFKVKHTEQYDQKNTINNERDHIGLQTTRVTEYIMSVFRRLGNMQLHADQEDTTGYHSISLHNSGCKESIRIPLELFYQNNQEVPYLLIRAVITRKAQGHIGQEGAIQRGNFKTFTRETTIPIMYSQTPEGHCKLSDRSNPVQHRSNLTKMKEAINAHIEESIGKLRIIIRERIPTLTEYKGEQKGSTQNGSKQLSNLTRTPGTRYWKPNAQSNDYNERD